MKTKDIEVEIDGKIELVTMKRLSYGEMNDLTEEATDVKVVNGQPIVKVSQGKLQVIALVKSIIKAPFQINTTEIRNLDPQIGNKLFEEFTELNSQENKKKD